MESQEINEYILIKRQIPSIILVTFSNNSSASIKLVSITCASTAGTSGDIILLLSNLSLSFISLIKDCNIHFSSFSCKKDMFFSNNLLFALISMHASIKNLKSAFGRIFVPISLPSRIQP